MTHINPPRRAVPHCPYRRRKITTPFLVNARFLRQVAVYAKGLVPYLSCQSARDDFWLLEPCGRARACKRMHFFFFFNNANIAQPSNIIIRI